MLLVAALVLVSGGLPDPVNAATRTWDGGGGDGLWSTAANWSLNTLPVPGDTVIFDGTSTMSATIDIPVTIAIFQMNAGYTGVITQSNTFTLTTSYTQSAGTFNGAGPTISVTGGTTINSGGTFNGGTSTINLNGALSVNAGGAFTSTTGTLTVTGAVTLAAGVFTHNGGSVVFSTSNVTLNLGGAATFNNVQFLSGTKTISAGNTMTVLGTLTLTGGTVNAGTIAAQGTIDAQSSFAGGSTTLLINGGGDQTWTGSQGAASDLPVVNINKGGGTLTMTGTFRTTRNWTFTASGGLTASASTVTFAAGTIIGSHTLGAVTMAGGTVTIATGTTLTATGTLTLTSGALNQAGATGTLAAQGDISIAAAFTGGSATLLINGTLPQTWSGTASGAANTLLIVNINDPASTLTITAALRTTRNWTFTASGGLTASASSIIFAGGTITGSHTLGAVTMAGGTVTIATGTTLTATGTLTLTSGALNQAGATGTLAAQGDISIAAAFTGGSATLLINGTLPQTWSGTASGAANTLLIVNINDPASTLTITAALRTTRNWTFTASGGLTASASSIIFAGGTITGSHTLGAVEVAGAVTIAAGTTLTVPGTLNLFSGSLNQAGATGTLAAQGDINAQIGYTGGGTATLLINGSGAQTLTGFHNSGTGSLPNVDIAKPSGTLTIAGTLRTARNWTYTSGGLTATGSTLIFNGTQTLTGNHTLDAVEIRGGTVTIAAGTTVTATGNVILFSGSFGGTGTLAAQANIDAASGFTGGTATLLINGSGAQLLSQAAIATSSLPLVNIAKPSGTLTMSGTFRTIRNWTYTSGGLNAAGTSILFAGTLTITGTQTLNAVEIAGTVTIAAGTTLTAAGTLTLTSGSLSTGTLAAQADINVAVGYTGSGSATLLIDGAGAQTLTGFHTTLAGSMPNVNIAKPSGTLTLLGTIRTARNWTYTSGGLIATGSTVIFNGTQTVTGSHTLDMVEVRGGALTVAAGTTLTVAGPLNLFSGSLSTGTLAAQGNINAQIGFTGGGTGTLLIDGSGAQTFTGFHTAGAGSLPNVNIAKPSGTLTITGTLRTARNWTYTSGALNAAGSTVIFNGTLTVTGSHTLGAVEFRAGDVTVAAGDTLTVAGFLTLTNGNLQGGTVDALGDISLAAAYDGETGTVRIAGTANQTLTGAANTTSSDMANVVIDKPSGTLFLVGTIRMTTSSWTWVQGALDPGTSTVYFDATVTIGGTHSLYNVYLSGGAHTVVGGDTLTALGTLTLDNGTIDGGTIAAAGPLTQLSTFDGGTGVLRVVGTGNQTFDGFATTGTGSLPDFEIDKPSGVLTLTGTIRTTNNWTHLNGTLDPDSSLVVFAAGLTIDAVGMTFADVEVTSGTATLASGLNVAGDLFVSGGTLDAASATVTVAGNVTIDGVFTPGTGLLVMNGGVPQILGGAAANIGLYDFTVNNAAGVTITTAVSVAGTLTLNGPLDISGQTLGIANPIAGTVTNLTGDPLSSLVVSGTGAGIIIPSSLPMLANLTLNNPNGATLTAPMTIGTLLTLTDGVLDAGLWVVVIDPAASVARTAGHVSGELRKTIPLGAGVAATFEIGDATTYAPVSLLFGIVSASGTITASTTPGEHPSIGSSVINPARDVNRWWSLVNAGTTFDALTATFTFDPVDVDPGASTAAFVVAKWDGAWVLPVSGAALPTSITAFGMTSLSEFAVGEVESGDLPDTAQDMAVPAPAVFLASLLAAFMVLAALAVPSMRARRRTAPIVASPRADWETFWQDRFR